MRVFTNIILFVVLGWLLFQLWLAPDGFRGMWRLQKQLQARESENAQLMERNNALAAEVSDLKRGFAAIEEHARTDLGMIRQDETFYKIVESDKLENDHTDIIIPKERPARK